MVLYLHIATVSILMAFLRNIDLKKKLKHQYESTNF